MNMVNAPSQLLEETARLCGTGVIEFFSKFMSMFECYRDNPEYAAHVIGLWSNPRNGQPSQIPVQFESFCIGLLKRWYKHQEKVRRKFEKRIHHLSSLKHAA
jgi:hypothetical protein